MFCFSLAGCVETAVVPKRGVVTEVSRALRVCFDAGRLQIGDTIYFLRSVCHANPKGLDRECQDQETGSARVVQLLDEHCAMVELAADADVRSGDAIAREGRR
jgi:hypothetical protein